jgi:hypothetical protein
MLQGEWHSAGSSCGDIRSVPMREDKADESRSQSYRRTKRGYCNGIIRLNAFSSGFSDLFIRLRVLRVHYS